MQIAPNISIMFIALALSIFSAFIVSSLQDREQSFNIVVCIWGSRQSAYLPPFFW
jgi:hypothetical protein